jgi:hypothetical protein
MNEHASEQVNSKQSMNNIENVLACAVGGEQPQLQRQQQQQ